MIQNTYLVWKFEMNVSDRTIVIDVQRAACYMSHITRKRVFGDFRPGKIQTNLLDYRSKLESWNFGYSKNTYHTI